MSSMPLRIHLSAFVQLRRLYSTGSHFGPVTSFRPPFCDDVVNLMPEKPVVLRDFFKDFPAISQWFQPTQPHSRSEVQQDVNFEYLEAYGSTIVPLELTRSTPSMRESESPTKAFERLDAPLQLLLESLKSERQSHPSTQLYLAQCSLADLPSELQCDLPTPSILQKWGRGDIYGSSLWMGRPPTRTPLHRDPNPNLFVQLAGKKVIRLMKPETGRTLYMEVRAGMGHANIRGEEMMSGEENKRLEKAVWGAKALEGTDAHGGEATLESGDCLFIPVGWWHSVRGFGEGVNCSVNWWFR